MALFDICVVDTDALSYLSHSPAAVLASAEAEKKWKYCTTSSDHHATFTSLYFSVDGLAGSEANSFIVTFGSSLSIKWDCSFNEILGWFHDRLVFALVWVTSACI